MFFVVFSKRMCDHFIVPTTWVQDFKWKNHVNRSLNKNQEYRIYWTTQKQAWINGTPNANFVPNFRAEIVYDETAIESCDICYLEYYTGMVQRLSKLIGETC